MICSTHTHLKYDVNRSRLAALWHAMIIPSCATTMDYMVRMESWNSQTMLPSVRIKSNYLDSYRLRYAVDSYRVYD